MYTDKEILQWKSINIYLSNQSKKNIEGKNKIKWSVEHCLLIISMFFSKEKKAVKYFLKQWELLH